MLDDAKDALHKLSTGQAVASFRDMNGEMVTYTPTSIPQLRAYIADLERQLGFCRHVGPIGFMF
jgi:hypothetical protein